MLLTVIGASKIYNEMEFGVLEGRGTTDAVYKLKNDMKNWIE